MLRLCIACCSPFPTVTSRRMRRFAVGAACSVGLAVSPLVLPVEAPKPPPLLEAVLLEAVLVLLEALLLEPVLLEAVLLVLLEAVLLEAVVALDL